jgi:sec-independent protein translocase protein TatC
MSSAPDAEDPDDLFAHTRMSLGDHIEELRTAMFNSIKGFGVALILGFVLAKPATQFIASPVERELNHFYNARVERKMKELAEQTTNEAGPEFLANKSKPIVLGVSRKEFVKSFDLERFYSKDDLVRLEAKDDIVKLTYFLHPYEMVELLQEKIREFIKPPTLAALSVTEAFMVWLQVAVYLGIVFASPWIFWQLWMFVGAGLYPTEKKLVHVYLPISLGLFLVGVLLCEFVVLPLGIHWLLNFNAWMNIEPELRLSEWLTFAIVMPLLFGIGFQLPLVMFFLERIGVFTVKNYTSHWRIAIFVIGVLSSLLAMAPDPFSVMAMMIPLCLLYFLGIWLCIWIPHPEPDLDAPDPDEMVEV